MHSIYTEMRKQVELYWQSGPVRNVTLYIALSSVSQMNPLTAIFHNVNHDASG